MSRLLLAVTACVLTGCASSAGNLADRTKTTSQQAATPSGMVRVDGVNIFYEIHGRGHPLLLLHAGSLSADMWRPYLATFAEHYRVIAPDMRGHGRSNNPKDTMSYRELADEMVAFMQALGIQKPLIAGFSDGGQVALEIGMRYPDQAQALIVGGAWFKFTENYRAFVRDAVGDESSPEADTARLARNHPEWAAWLDEIYGPGNWKPLLTHLKRTWTTPLNYTPEDFAQVVAPTLVLIGDRDELVPVEEAAEMSRLLATAELGVVPGADHSAFFSETDVFQSVMLDFLRRHSGAPR